jgi:hypothetical protein
MQLNKQTILYDSVIIYHAMIDLITEAIGYEFRLQNIYQPMLIFKLLKLLCIYFVGLVF